MLVRDGIVCEWWRRVGQISPSQVAEKLTERNLRWHLDRYRDIDPNTKRPFFEATPFISLSAGTREPDASRTTNVRKPAHETAIRFATRRYREAGHVFYCYVMVLPNPSVRLQEFAEDVRDFHSHSSYSPYRHQGEVTAKIHVPSVRLQRVERYEPRSGSGATRTRIWLNPHFAPPEDHVNVRKVI